MNIIYANIDTSNILANWIDENHRLILINGKYNRNYFTKCQIVFEEGYYIYAEEKKDHVKLTVHDSETKQMMVKIKVTYDTTQINDYICSYDIKDKDEVKTWDKDDVETFDCFMKLMIQAYLSINTFFIYGNIVEDREVVIHSKSQGNDKVFTFRKYDDKIYAVQTTAHRSPEGIFSVRGHFRKYKDGKIVWIDEYLKGVNKE